ncbi:unnamed protein product [Boreogadus saida]
MACGATLKRSLEFEALLSPGSPKRRRCSPLPGAPSTPSPQRCNLRPPVENPSMSPVPTAGGETRLTPEQIFQNLRHEYSRIQRRRQLEAAFNQSEAASPSSALTAPCSPPGLRLKEGVFYVRAEVMRGWCSPVLTTLLRCDWQASRKDAPWFTCAKVARHRGAPHDLPRSTLKRGTQDATLSGVKIVASQYRPLRQIYADQRGRSVLVLWAQSTRPANAQYATGVGLQSLGSYT